MTTTPLAPGYTRTRPATGARKGTSTYSALLAQVKENGLLRRRTGFYWALFGALIGSLALATLTASSRAADPSPPLPTPAEPSAEPVAAETPSCAGPPSAALKAA